MYKILEKFISVARLCIYICPVFAIGHSHHQRSHHIMSLFSRYMYACTYQHTAQNIINKSNHLLIIRIENIKQIANRHFKFTVMNDSVREKQK